QAFQPNQGMGQPAPQAFQPNPGMGQPTPQAFQPNQGMGQPAPQAFHPNSGMNQPASGFTNNNGQFFKPTPEPVKAPEQPAAPEPVKAPEQPVAPEAVKAPEQPVAPEAVKAPEQPVAPEVVKAPEQPAAPEAVKAPEQPAAPEPAKAPEQPVFSEKAPQILPEEQPKAPTFNPEPGKPAIQSGLDFEQTTIIKDYDKTEPLSQGESIENQLRMAFGSASKPARELAATGSTDVLSDDYDSDLPEPNFVRERTGERFFITKPEFKIGKSRLHADYAIDGNTAISRIHCIVVQKNGVNYIKDNASTNGTFVDENKVEASQEVLLKDGVTVRLGDEIFTFHLKRR
ncbi:MAG: FHA domain-containing protein, partial [Eubacterium sp.]|nr:FHA domain-containing protein [Eubacterium sp.]